MYSDSVIYHEKRAHTFSYLWFITALFCMKTSPVISKWPTAAFSVLPVRGSTLSKTSQISWVKIELSCCTMAPVTFPNWPLPLSSLPLVQSLPLHIKETLLRPTCIWGGRRSCLASGSVSIFTRARHCNGSFRIRVRDAVIYVLAEFVR